MIKTALQSDGKASNFRFLRGNYTAKKLIKENHLINMQEIKIINKINMINNMAKIQMTKRSLDNSISLPAQLKPKFLIIGLNTVTILNNEEKKQVHIKCQHIKVHRGIQKERAQCRLKMIMRVKVPVIFRM